MKILISTSDTHPTAYSAAIEAAGGDPVAAYLPAFDGECAGLVLAGGGDTDPAFYGQENRGCTEIDYPRDVLELELLERFVALGRPVLAICRGHQLVNVWAGGTLVQDLGPELNPFHRGKTDMVHSIRTEEGSLLRRLYGEVIPVNSIHHQAVDRLGAGLLVTARSEGGVVEAMEHESLPLISVQFHPERMTGRRARPDTVDGAAIFEHFMALCRER